MAEMIILFTKNMSNWIVISTINYFEKMYAYFYLKLY